MCIDAGLVGIMCCSFFFFFFFFNDTATTEIYTLSLHDALPIRQPGQAMRIAHAGDHRLDHAPAAHPRDVADHRGQLDVGLLQRLLDAPVMDHVHRASPRCQCRRLGASPKSKLTSVLQRHRCPPTPIEVIKAPRVQLATGLSAPLKSRPLRRRQAKPRTLPPPPEVSSPEVRPSPVPTRNENNRVTDSGCHSAASRC